MPMMDVVGAGDSDAPKPPVERYGTNWTTPQSNSMADEVSASTLSTAHPDLPFDAV